MNNEVMLESEKCKQVLESLIDAGMERVSLIFLLAEFLDKTVVTSIT